MKDLFAQGSAALIEWQNLRLSDYKLIKEQHRILGEIEKRWHESPAREFYTDEKG